jgi:hypothetical protein
MLKTEREKLKTEMLKCGKREIDFVWGFRVRFAP